MGNDQKWTTKNKDTYFENMDQYKFFLKENFKKDNIKKENLIKRQPIEVSLESKKKILFQMNNCICKLCLKNDEIGIGFLCRFPFINNALPALITDNHIINYIDNNKCIKLKFNNEVKEIKIDNSRKIRHGEKFDITIIEIKPNRDKIYNYLEINENDIYKNEKFLELEYKKREIYIIYYENEEVNVSYGLINEMKKNKNINYYCKKEDRSFGSPILSLKTFKVIGIHYDNSQNIN